MSNVEPNVQEYVDNKLKDKDEEIKNIVGRLKGIEFDPSIHYPRDTYSFIALNGPKDGEWTGSQKKFFLIGMIPFAFQLTMVIMLLINVLSNGPGDVRGNVPVIVAQFIAILLFVLNPGGAIMDVVTAFQLWPDHPGHKTGRTIACFFLLLQGLCSCIGNMVLIANNSDVFGVLMNFPLFGFISGVHGATFELFSSGVLGESLVEECARIADFKLPKKLTNERKLARFREGMLFILLAFCIPHIIFLIRPADQCTFFSGLGFEVPDGHWCDEFSEA